MAADFEEVFLKTLDQLELDAKACGHTLTSICRETAVSRATPDRWRKTIPKTILLVAEMQRVVREHATAPLKVKVDGIEQTLAKGHDGSEKAPTGLHTD